LFNDIISGSMKAKFDSPLVTVSIPTKNSAKTIGLSLAAVKRQTYTNIEINIVDAESHDETVKIAKDALVKDVLFCTGSLLKSRYIGVREARGDYVLLLDSDQILQKTAVEDAVRIFTSDDVDMLALEETVYEENSFLETLFALDRKLINTVNNLSEFTGVIMPRFFKTSLIRAAYRNIPKSLFVKTGGPDHAIVYYEAKRLSHNVGVIKNAVKHKEPTTYSQFWKKYYHWGYTSLDAHYGKYKHLMSRKERFRTGLFTKGLILASFGSILLLILKGVPFKIGYFTAAVQKSIKKLHN